MLRFIVSETGMWSLPKALSQSRPNQPVDKQNDLLSASFRECLVTPFQREFTLSARDCKVRWPENKCLKTSGSSQSAFECVCVFLSMKECVCPAVCGRLWNRTLDKTREAPKRMICWCEKQREWERKKCEWRKLNSMLCRGRREVGVVIFWRGVTGSDCMIGVGWGGETEIFWENSYKSSSTRREEVSPTNTEILYLLSKGGAHCIKIYNKQSPQMSGWDLHSFIVALEEMEQLPEHFSTVL